VGTLGKLAQGNRAAGVANRARRETQTLERSRGFEWLVRAGFVARAITYGVIGGLGGALALGAGTDGTAPNQQGALALIGRSAIGRIALVLISAGLLAYALWKLTQGIFGRGPEGGGGYQLTDRIANLAGGGVYVAFFVVAIRVLIGSAGNSSSEPRKAASGVLGWPGGPVIVGIGGAVLIAISLYQLYDALRGEFSSDSKTSEMGPRERRVFMALGRVGLTARALVFALVGYFVVRAAIDYNPSNAVGVDGALARLHNQTLGPGVLAVVAAGLLTFAAFSLLEARYRRL
jgi:Domain of Unknown Function (DUF1206)